MIINQLFYSYKPFRFKDKALFDILSTGIFSPALKFIAGWSLFTINYQFPYLAVLPLIIIQPAGFLLYKLRGYKEVNKIKHKKTTVIVLKKTTVLTLSKILFTIGFLSFLFLTLIPLKFQNLKHQLQFHQLAEEKFHHL